MTRTYSPLAALPILSARVVAFNPPTDFMDVCEDVERGRQRLIRRKRLRPQGHLDESVLHRAGLVPPHTSIEDAGNYVTRLLGVEPDLGRDLYRQLFPANRVGQRYATRSQRMSMSSRSPNAWRSRATRAGSAPCVSNQSTVVRLM